MAAKIAIGIAISEVAIGIEIEKAVVIPKTFIKKMWKENVKTY